VGFKYIADLFLKKKIIFGGEESACLTIKDHLPEKDGILAGLLVAEIVASAKKPLSELIENLHQKYGRRVFKQESRPISLEVEKKLTELIASPPGELAGRKVENVVKLDGIKLDFSGDDWVLLRLSGTEPLIRCYAEAEEEAEVDKLMKAAWEKIG
jgi:phosphoglucomutase